MADIDVLESDGVVLVVATADGQNVFAFDFLAYTADTVFVTYRPGTAFAADLLLGVDYTVAGLSQENGGTITLAGDYLGVMLEDEEILIYRSTPVRRLFDYQNAGDFRADTVNRELDLMVMMDQEARRDIDRSLKSPLGTPPVDLTITPGADGLVAMWMNGNLGVGPNVADIAAAQAYAEEAQAARDAAILAAASVQATIFPILSAVDAYHPEFAPAFFLTIGHSNLFDKGGARYAQVPGNVEPTHLGKKSMVLDDASVVWYEIADNYLNVKQFGAKGDGVTNDTPAVQSAITFANGRKVHAPTGDYFMGALVNCADPTQLEAYRPGVKLWGDGPGLTVFINGAAECVFKHAVTEVQGASNYFTRGVEFAYFEIVPDAAIPANSSGIKIQGSYHPWFHDIIINGMTADAIDFYEETPGWAGTPNPDRYAVADAIIDRCNLSSNTRRGVGIYNAACQVKIRGCYIVSNLKAGVGPYGSVHEINGNSVSGNGTYGDAEGGGLAFLRHPTWGTPQNIDIHHNEIDANRNRQVLIDGANCTVEYNRFNDDPTWYPDSGGEVLAAVQVEVAPAASSSANENIVRNNSFRFTNLTDKNATCVRFHMAATGDRNMRRNRHEASVIGIFGATSGVITEHAETNTTHALAVGNRWASVDVPIGISKIITGTKNMADASATQTIAFGFKPAKVKVVAWVVGTEHKSEGEMSIDGVDNGLYFYPTSVGWFTHTVLITIRTGAGDIYTATGRLAPGALYLDWVKTGAPAGVIDFMITAEP
jgi:hypothetical protein